MRAAVIAVLCACGHDRGSALIFTHAEGSLHEEAIAAARDVLPDELRAAGIDAEVTEDPTVLHDLASYDAVVFLYYTGNGLVDADGRAAFEDFVAHGGGWVGIHATAVAEAGWPFFQDLLVTPFLSHPDIQPATVHITEPGQEPVAALPLVWDQTDEWYNFPRDAGSVLGVDVLATVDETTYTGGTMGEHHPIVWSHSLHNGRAIFTALGHMGSRWSEPAFVRHMVDSVRWAAHR